MKTMTIDTFNAIVAQFPSCDGTIYAATLENETPETLAQWAGYDTLESGRLVGVVRFQNEKVYEEVEHDGKTYRNCYDTDTASMDAMRAAFRAAGFETKRTDIDDEVSTEEFGIHYLVVLARA